MQKNNFFAIIALFATTSLMPMESTLAIKEKPKFIVTLDSHEREPQNIHLWKSLDKDDIHACKVLGITWEENNNKYFINSAFIKKFGEAKYFNCWRRNFMGNLKSTIPYKGYSEEFQYLIKFPETLPATFIERLEKEKSITLENTHFAEPVEIIIELDKLRKLKKQAEESSSTELKNNEEKDNDENTPLFYHAIQ